MLRTIFVLVLILVGGYYSFRAPFFGLLFYIANAYFRPEDWVYGDLIRNLRLSLVIGTFLVLSTCFSKHKFIVSGRIVLLWLFLIISLMSCLVSDYSAYSWPFLFEFFKVIVISYGIIVLTTDFAKFRLVILTMVLALGLENGKQGWFYLLTSPGSPNANPIAFLGDNNGTAVGMLMLVPLIGILIQSTDNKWSKWSKRFFGFLLIGCLYRALSTYSRGGFLAAIAVAVGWGLRSTNKLRTIIGILVVAAVVMPMLPSAFWGRMGTIQTFEEEKDESALGRLHFWSVALQMARDHPLVGVGFNSYNVAYDSYDFSGGEHGKGRSVHNSVFGVIAETGFIGLFLYLAILWNAFRACSYARRVGLQQSELRYLSSTAVAIEGSLIAFVIGGSFVPFQYNEMLWHVIALSTVLMRLAEQKQLIITSPAIPHEFRPSTEMQKKRSAA